MKNIDEMLAKGSIFGGDTDAGSAVLVAKGSAEWEVMIEGRGSGLLFTGEKEAALGLTMVHSVLNMKFNKRIKAFCMFVQKLVLNIDDGIKMPSPVLSFVNGLS